MKKILIACCIVFVMAGTGWAAEETECEIDEGEIRAEIKAELTPEIRDEVWQTAFEEGVSSVSCESGSEPFLLGDSIIIPALDVAGKKIYLEMKYDPATGKFDWKIK